MTATVSRTALLATASSPEVLARNPAWIATGGVRGARDAVETTFVSPVLKGAVWFHEDNGLARLVAMDPRTVVEQLQRSANAVLRAQRRPEIRVDATWGPATREALRALAEARAFPNATTPVRTGDDVLAVSLLEWALLAAFHGGRGQVVLPRRMELPSFTAAQRVASSPVGHADAVTVLENGQRVALAAAPIPVPTPDALLASAVTPLAPATPPAVVTPAPPTPVPATPVVATASTFGSARGLVIAGGIGAAVYVAYVVARELRAPSPSHGSRHFPRRRLVAARTREASR